MIGIDKKHPPGDRQEMPSAGDQSGSRAGKTTITQEDEEINKQQFKAELDKITKTWRGQDVVIDDGRDANDEQQNKAFSRGLRNINKIWESLARLDLDGYSTNQMDDIWRRSFQRDYHMNLPEEKAMAIDDIINAYEKLAAE